MTILVYSLPFFIYLCSSIFSSVLTIKASKSGADPLFISLIVVCLGIGMMLTAGFFSKFNIPKRIFPRLLYIETILQIIISVCALIYLPEEMILLYSFLFGSTTTIFFVCFQSLLDTVSKDFPIRISSGLFILSWTLGLSLGPIITGFIYELSPSIGFIIVIVMSVIIFVFFYMSRHLHFKTRHHKWEEPFTRAPRYKVYIGWLIIFVGAAVLHTLRIMFLDYGIKEAHFSESQVGILVGVLAGFMSVGAVISSFYLRFLEKKRVFTIVGLLTPIALTLILTVSNFWLFFVAFMSLGFVSGFGYFFGLYYALADQENASVNIAINETLTGVAALFIPFIVGFLASKFSYFIGFLFMMIVSSICYGIGIYIMWQQKRTAMVREKMKALIETIDKKYKE